jgi:hypothetical protein
LIPDDENRFKAVGDGCRARDVHAQFSFLCGAEGKTFIQCRVHERLTFPVVKTYAAKDGAHEFRAYVIEWKGQEVVAQDTLVRTKNHSDDTITVLVQKNFHPDPKQSHGLLHFTVMANKSASSPSVRDVATPSPAPEPSGGYAEIKVLKVYSAQDENYVFRAYVVEWKGQEVIVRDTLARTNHNVGDMITATAHFHPNPDPSGPSGLMSFEIVPPELLARMRRR